MAACNFNVLNQGPSIGRPGATLGSWTLWDRCQPPQSPVWGLPGYPVETALSNKVGNDPPTHNRSLSFPQAPASLYSLYLRKKKTLSHKTTAIPEVSNSKALSLFLMGGVGEGLWEQGWAYLCSLSPSFRGRGREGWLHLTGSLGEKTGHMWPSLLPLGALAVSAL